MASSSRAATYAGDPHLDGDEARTRFMLPVQFPSYVVALDGRDLGACSSTTASTGAR